jgi:hypothetical protein
MRHSAFPESLGFGGEKVAAPGSVPRVILRSSELTLRGRVETFLAVHWNFRGQSIASSSLFEGKGSRSFSARRTLFSNPSSSVGSLKRLSEPLAVGDLGEWLAIFPSFADPPSWIAKRDDRQHVQIFRDAQEQFDFRWSHKANPV